MNILFGISPQDGWARAAKYLGHSGFELDFDKPFYSFGISNPDLVILHKDESSLELERCIKKYNKPILYLDEIPIGSDCPPNFQGKFREEFKSKVIIIGSYDKSYDKYLLELINNNIDFKVFGHKGWKIPQYLGYLLPQDIGDTFFSADFVLDLDGDYSRVMAIASAGGLPISACNHNIEGLYCPSFNYDEKELIRLIQTVNPVKNSSKIPTLAEKLKEILCKFTV